jgi:hypothetical protein
MNIFPSPLQISGHNSSHGKISEGWQKNGKELPVLPAQNSNSKQGEISAFPIFVFSSFSFDNTLVFWVKMEHKSCRKSFLLQALT